MWKEAQEISSLDEGTQKVWWGSWSGQASGGEVVGLVCLLWR